jgi:tetratricopeptide (TPR) repeat protein
VSDFPVSSLPAKISGPDRGHRPASWLWNGGRACIVSALLLACRSPITFVATPGPYDQVPLTWHEDLAAARLAFERGDSHTALSLVAPLCIEQPRVLPVRLFLQDIELSLLVSEGRVGSLVASSSAEARAVLARYYDGQADARAAAEGYVLAARLAADGEEAMALLAEADTIDPRCVWVHYGRAWWFVFLRRYKEARESLRTALRLDNGHLPSLRLTATIVAGAGESEDAAKVLEVWLERTAKNPLFAGVDRADALLDLAALEVMLDEPKKALKLLEELDPRAVRDPARAEEVRAAAHEARGELSRALEAVNRASALRPGALLPLVQQAILLQAAGDAEGERKSWERLLELAEQAPESDPSTGIDFAEALFTMQAHVRLARLARETPKP